MKVFSIFISCCFCTINLFAQSPKAIEVDLLKAFKRIAYWEEHQSDNNYAYMDSLPKANSLFANKLKYYVEKYSATINYPFNSLVKEHLDISTSMDGMLRIYSWDTLTGGTMHWFESVMQYKVGKNVFSVLDTPKKEGDVRPNYHKVFTLRAQDKTYYLAVYLGIGSTIDAVDGISIFTVENGKLNDAKIIKTQSGLHNNLSYDYDFGSVVDISYEKRPRIRFDNSTNTIYLPLVDGNRQITNKFILYKFTGQYFERIKN